MLVFNFFLVTPPNHVGYVQFPAALLIVFSLMFVHIAFNPAGNRDLILYGMLMKVAYCGVVCFHWFSAGIPYIWKPFAICDVLFLVIFGWSFVALGKDR